MPRLPLPFFALALLLGGCAGSHKPAEAPDFTEKGWSGPNPELTGAKADRPIQGEAASTSNGTDATGTLPLPMETAPAAAAPATAGATTDPIEAAVVSGNALPPAPAQAAKQKKGKKPKKGKKKTTATAQ